MMQRPLTAQDLLAHGPFQRLGREIFLHDEIHSTNAFLRERVGEAADGSIAVAEYQSAGRGRRGRSWVAPRGSSLLLSVLLFEPEGSPLVTHAAMLASLAAVEAVDAVTDISPGVRWPNDIVVARKKLGGVLVESLAIRGRPGSGSGARAIIIGIGINCLQQRGHFAGELAEKATSIEIESSRPVDRAAIAGHLVRLLDAHLSACLAEPDGWKRLVAAWKACCGDIGVRATLQHDVAVFEGTVLDIDDRGDLIVQLDQGGRRHFGAATTTRLW